MSCAAGKTASPDRPRSKLAGRPRPPVKPLPLFDAVQRWLSYDPVSGVLRWKARKGQRPAPGSEAGYISADGYRRIEFDEKVYLAHRLAWLLHYGVPPKAQVDHVNGDGGDNRIENLREATPAQNAMNRKVRADNRCGIKGVRQFKNGRWQVYVKDVYIGRFDTAEAGGQAYAAAAATIFGEFARPSTRVMEEGGEPSAAA